MPDLQAAISEPQIIRYLGIKFNAEELSLAEWSMTKLNWKASNTVTDALYRITGMVLVDGMTLDWSFILKVIIPAPETDDPNHYCYWKREPLLYQSGLLKTLPEPVRAPQCYGVEQGDDGTWRMWLEEITEHSDGPWELPRYGEIAEMLGQFNGAYLAGLPLPSEPWLCRGFLQSWTHECDKYDSGIARLEETWAQSRVKELLPEGTFERYLSFCQNRELLLASLQKLPKVLTHNDAWRPNLFPSAGRGLTMIDWSNCGLAGVGEELGRYYGLSLNADLGALADKRAFADEMAIRYCEGLRKAGWYGDDRLAKFGFMASAGTRCGMMFPSLFEQLSRLPETDEVPAKWNERCTVALHLLELAEASIEMAGGAT
ncbi:phosphotransferase [Cohnella sp. GCM10020058]|uniref:phosphotransferase n=1 Tax=Cohnella sp. GCM10020058 TaxID=3317330 RepID=UPI0036338B55